MVLNVVDVTSGCLYATNMASEKVTYHLDDLEGRKEEDIRGEVLKRALPDILKRQASTIAQELAGEPWSGRVLSAENGQVTISAGNDVGVRPGLLFTVFAKGESIVCQSGRPLEILGKKVGEIKTTSVAADRSSAVPLEGGPFKSGQIVIVKR